MNRRTFLAALPLVLAARRALRTAPNGGVDIMGLFVPSSGGQTFSNLLAPPMPFTRANLDRAIAKFRAEAGQPMRLRPYPPGY